MCYNQPMEKNFDPLFAAIQAGLHKKNSLTVAIDGPCASGKTSLAAVMQERFNARIIPMDDFFLPKELRTKERYATAGGNVHFERFLTDVAPFIDSANAPSDIRYQPFDCREMAYGSQRFLPFLPLTIIEGTYSLHPSLRHLYDIKVLLTISEEEQAERLLRREGAERFIVFENRWIPLENLYFSQSNLKSICDFII